MVESRLFSYDKIYITSTTYLCKRATARWIVLSFLNVIDIAAYNALVLWITRNEQWNHGKSCARRVSARTGNAACEQSHSRACQFVIEQTPANTRGCWSVGHQWRDCVREIIDESDVRCRRCGLCPRRPACHVEQSHEE